MSNQLKTLFPLITLIVLCVIIGLISPKFFTLANFVRLLASASVPLILICGMTFVITLGSIDLSLEGILAVAAVTTGYVAIAFAGTPYVLLAYPIAVAAGAAIGALNGILHVGLLVPSLLTTLGVGFAGIGLATLMSAGGSIVIRDPLLRTMVFERVLGVPGSVWIAALAVLVALYIQHYTRLGRWTYVLGGGEDIARLSGLPIRKIRIGVFTLAGAFFGLGGAVLGSQLGLGQIQITTGFMFSTITAVIVGGTLLTGGVGGVLNSCIGVFVIVVLSNGMVLMGIPTPAQLGAQGLLTLLAVAVSLDRRKTLFVK